jgi:hypothetical protein
MNSSQKQVCEIGSQIQVALIPLRAPLDDGHHNKPSESSTLSQDGLTPHNLFTRAYFSHTLITDPSTFRKLSLFTRLLGFGSCLLGAFAIGYVQGAESVPAALSKLIQNSAGSVPNLSEQVTAKFASYMQQNVTPPLNTYLAIGIITAVGGFILVAMGDRKAKIAKEQPPLQSQVPLRQQE